MPGELAYLDFDVLLDRSGQRRYQARVVNAPAGQTPPAKFALPFSEREIEGFLLRIFRPRGATRRVDASEIAAVRTFGARLYQALFNGALEGNLLRSLTIAEAQGAGLRIRLRLSDVPELASLPWEFMYDEARGSFLCLSHRTPLVRFLEVPDPPRPMSVSPPLHMLVIISSPSDYPPLDVQLEWARLREALRPLEKAGQVHVTQLETATLTALRQQLRRADWHVLHFVGHGDFDDQAQDGLLVLQDDSGQSRLVTGQDLMLHDHKPLRLVVLNACESARSHPSNPFVGAAQTLIRQGIPAVVAMQFEITDPASITFISEFYKAVTDGYPVDGALAEARKAVWADRNQVEWAIPVLFMRSPDGRVFEMTRQDAPVPAGPAKIEAVAHVPTAGPAQLPPDIRDFTGREETVAEIRRLLEQPTGEKETAVIISAIAGKAGVGKTALAVRVAHQLRTQFSGGQLYINLRGAEAQKLDPADVLASFLRSLGVEGSAIPESLDERSRLYRERLAQRRALIVLDNAADEAQVRPLLPGSPSCGVLITSRRRLGALEGTHQVPLEVLDPDKAVELLGRVAGAERVAAEQDASRDIVRLCGHLPLAVRIAGARLAAKPHWSIRRLADLLADERRRLSELRAGDLDVRPSFALSYRGCDPDEQRTFRLLGLLQAADFPSWVAAALLLRDRRQAGSLVEALVDAQLLEVAGTDGINQTRYRFHDLLRDFARECLSEETEPAQKEALDRVSTGYLVMAASADDLLAPGHAAIRDVNARPSWLSDDTKLLDPEVVSRNPLGWLTIERPNLIIAARQAREIGSWSVTWELADTLSYFFELRGHWQDWELVDRLALEAARAAGDRSAEGYMLLGLGLAARYQGRWDDAVTSFTESLPIFKTLGDRRGEARTLYSLGIAVWYQGHWRETLRYFNESLPVFRELGDKRWEGYAQRSFGIFYRYLGRLDEAQESLRQALWIFRSLNDRGWEGFTLRTLGEVYTDQRQFDKALDALQQCLPIFLDLGYRHAESSTVVSIGDVYRNQGRFAEAMAYLEQGLSTFRSLNDQRWIAYALHSMGEIYRQKGQADDALKCFTSCLSTFRTLGELHGEARTLTSLGRIAADQGRADEASVRWRQALAMFDELEAPEGAEVRGLLEP